METFKRTDRNLTNSRGKLRKADGKPKDVLGLSKGNLRNISRKLRKVQCKHEEHLRKSKIGKPQMNPRQPWKTEGET